MLSLDRVSYRYPGAAGRPPALRELTLMVEPGELVVVAGGSGCGKSTLLRLASGLVPHFHGGEITGEVIVGGLDARDHGPGELAAVVGTLVQDPETQVVMGTVRAELAFPLHNRGLSAAAVARGVEEAALALGIAHLLERSTADLSGGELQRVALGAALAPRPALLVLDEPTSQLDPVAGDELVGVLRRLGEDFDTAVLVSEHRLERVLPAADRVVALVAGTIAFDGAPGAFLAWALHSQPALATPGASLLAELGLASVAGVRAARRTLRQAGLMGAAAVAHEDVDEVDGAERAKAHPRRFRRSSSSDEPALEFRGVWHELDRGPVILRGLDFRVEPGERVALMGRNGAGKSTLLRHAAGLMKPTRGRVSPAGRVALLLQNPGDYLIHETVAEEAPAAARGRVSLGEAGLASRHPRELSGGERQRLALAVVLGSGEAPAVLCLDEPTRGMDRHARSELAALLENLGSAVLVATHDPEFVAAFARRVVLLADGAAIADGSTEEILAGGSYFATETARIVSGALRPEDALAKLDDRRAVPA